MILHIDMDAFYASVEERDNSELRGIPLVVGGRPEGRGVVAAANYAARGYGIHSAMPMARAVRLCRSLKIVAPRAAVYREVSGQISEIFKRYTPQIEPLSLDEAFLDVRASQRLYGSSEAIGRRIKTEILKELGLVASVGVAPNKFLAKLASDHDKPDGFTVIAPEQVQVFLDPLPVARIWGVGKAAQATLHRAGIQSVKDLRAASPEWLTQTFGKSGKRLEELCRGVDDRPVISDVEARSISHETTFSRDICDLSHLEAVALSLTEGVCYRLRRAALKARTMHLKIRYHDFSTTTRSQSLQQRTDHTLEIWDAIRNQMKELLAGRQFSVRLVGVGVSNFQQPGGLPINTRQTDLVDQVMATQGDCGSVTDRQRDLDQLSDEIRQRFGKGKIRRGRSL
jgi:DNA polymerase-4